MEKMPENLEKKNPKKVQIIDHLGGKPFPALVGISEIEKASFRQYFIDNGFKVSPDKKNK